jgi:hypothetical protein
MLKRTGIQTNTPPPPTQPQADHCPSCGDWLLLQLGKPVYCPLCGHIPQGHEIIGQLEAKRPKEKLAKTAGRAVLNFRLRFKAGPALILINPADGAHLDKIQAGTTNATVCLDNSVRVGHVRAITVKEGK